MDAKRMADLLKEVVDTYVDCGAEVLGEVELEGATTQTFGDAWVMTMNQGLVVTLADGSEFQVTVVKSRGVQ